MTVLLLVFVEKMGMYTHTQNFILFETQLKMKIEPEKKEKRRTKHRGMTMIMMMMTRWFAGVYPPPFEHYFLPST